MKKVIFTLLFVLPLFVFGQTIVDTEPQDKNVVLEQYTGINCGFCPQGSAIANQIYNANPDRVVVIAVHAGGFANPGAGQPDFRTPFGPSLLGQTGITGFPAGTVNRHVFPGFEMTPGGTGMGRGNWTSAANQILPEPSYLNVGAEAQIDLTTRELTVDVEVYYTGDSPLATNKLNVALLQDKTYAFQAGGSSDYEHNNRLVHLLSGQWGADITSTTEGSLHTQTFTYTIPDEYNQIPAELENMRVAVFVAENTQEVISGIQVTPSYLNAPEFEYGIIGHSIPSDLWDGVLEPVIEIKSFCQDLTSLDIEYSVNDGAAYTFEWEGSLQYAQTSDITLPQIEFDLLDVNELVITILNEDDSPDNNSLTVTFNAAPATDNNDLTVQVRTDQYGSEITWNITDQEGTIVANGGPYPNSVNTHNHDVTIPVGNYSLIIIDSYGDGILGGGYIRLLDGEETIVNIPGNSYTSTGSKKFKVIEQDITIFFDIDDGDLDIDIDGIINIYFNVPVTHTDESEITNENVAQLISYATATSGKEDVDFTATISEDKKHINIIPVNMLEFNTAYMVELAPVMAPDQTITEPVSIVFTTRTTYGAPVATFDVIDESTDVPADHTFTVEFNQPVRHADGSEITFLNIGQLITFRKDNMEGDAVSLSSAINEDKTVITLDPLADLLPNQQYILGIGELMGLDDEISEPIYITFTTDDALSAGTFDLTEINIYPNPARNKFYVDLPAGSGEMHLRLFDISGKLIFSKVTNAKQEIVEIENLKSGLYFVEIESDGFSVRKKIAVTD